MRYINGWLVVVATLLSAAPLAAQTSSAPDSTKVATLATVTVTAPGGNWFTRADELRRTVANAMAENRRLADELRRQDARVALLAVRLDSLKRIEFVQKIAIAAIDDSVAATRARRRALEAKVIALESRAPQP